MAPATKSIDALLAGWFLRRTPSTGVRRVASLAAAVASDVGSVREENQDRVAIARGLDRSGRPYVALALADGIGGMRQGAECAAMTLGSFFAGIEQEAQSGTEVSTWLLQAAMRANSRVHAELGGKGGATLVATLVLPGKNVHWLSVGDSRVHLSRGLSLHQVSTDDTIAGQLGKPPEAGLDRSNLLQFIGTGPQLEPHVEALPHTDARSILLTSDGVHFIDPAWLGQIVGHAPDAGMCVRRLVELSKWCGGPDNASVGMIELDASLEWPNGGSWLGLEVWDSFGELHLISTGPAPIAHPQHIASRSMAGGSSQNAIDSDRTPDLASPPSKDKSKRTRSGRKPKGAAQKRTAPKDGDAAPAERPQLVIKFPNKTT